jgi:hypothetical protein
MLTTWQISQSWLKKLSALTAETVSQNTESECRIGSLQKDADVVRIHDVPFADR